MPSSMQRDQHHHYQTVARIIRYMHKHAHHQPSLKQLAQEAKLSEFHLQRVFSEWAGISPKRFLQFITKEHAKGILRQSQDLLSTSLQAGLSSGGRLHDLMISCEAMTPGEIKSRGDGVEISYGFAFTPFGNALVGWTKRGVCYLEFCDTPNQSQESAMRAHWPNATFHMDAGGAAQLMRRIFPKTPGRGKLHLVLSGTNFQIKVWEALLRVAPGQLVTYSYLADLAGHPRAARAVGTALASNVIGYLIPCHRVIRESGEISSYRWGIERKAALIAWEAPYTERK